MKLMKKINVEKFISMQKDVIRMYPLKTVPARKLVNLKDGVEIVIPATLVQMAVRKGCSVEKLIVHNHHMVYEEEYFIAKKRISSEEKKMYTTMSSSD